LTHETDVGYELTTALAVSAADGSPLAPMEVHLRTADEVHSTSPCPPAPGQHHLEQILPIMAASRGWGLTSRLVHMIDREADSVGHLRQWDAAGHLFLVRADDRRVRWDGQSMLLSEVVAQLGVQRAFVKTRKVEYQGRPAQQWVAQTLVTLDRPAKKRVDGRQKEVAGPKLALRLIVAQVRDGRGRVLATWMLLTNATDDVPASLVALWYYWRWRIESFFKLLKSGGQQIEHWLQETGGAIARRLLVAAMACVLVWDLERQTSPQAQELKGLLVRLSGRQMKHRRSSTASAMLAGLFVLLPLLDLLAEHGGDLREVQRLALRSLPFLDTR
jgi:hypothetical protein